MTISFKLYLHRGAGSRFCHLPPVKSGNSTTLLPLSSDSFDNAPWEFHRIKSAGGTSPSLFVMSFYAEGELPKKLSEVVFTLTPDQIVQYNGIFEEIHAFLKTSDSSAYAGQNAADGLSVFLVGISEENVSSIQDNSASAIVYRKVILAMSKAVCENKTLSDFGYECGASVSYIKKMFAKYAGISPKSYYNNLRITHALGLLKSGRSINEVAEEMNFSSSNYFSEFIKKHTGESPISYKKSRS